MDEKNLPSSSDESDVDFVPKEEEDNSDSGSEVSDCETSEGETNSGKSRKRKKKTKKYGKKAKSNESEKTEEDNVEEEEKKTEIDVDALWADFKKDVNSKSTKTTESSLPSSKTETDNLGSKSSEVPAQKNSLNTKPRGTLNFPNNKKVGGLSKVLNQIGKKDKMSTLQKSQMDWNKFKKSEGIEEEIKMYNRGKDGYLDKQDFLQRTDLRQFEIEKDLRSSRRKF